jgi:hypothetical protein
MVNRAFHLAFGAHDFGFQGGDAGLKLLDRQGIKVLLDQHNQRIAGTLRQDIVQIHAPNVDPPFVEVNEAGDAFWG